MMNWLREFLKSTHMRFLEAECERLRQENRALLNSLLGVAGHSPVEFPAEPARPPVIKRSGLSMHQVQKKTERESEQRFLDRMARANQRESA